ncbi:MAG: hypothetical protein MI754_06020 [Chromatiales bacterium]|nr:hypothetical protein [Chromatiales bacterium]
MKKLEVLSCLIVVFCLLTGFSKEHNLEKQSQFSGFFQSLKGNWKGCAVKTPVGPRPYDIHFRYDEEGYLSGVADPGPVSDHHWAYQTEDGVLRLRFLSTFRGNEVPTWLSAVAKKGSTLTFRSEKVRKLKVEVTIIDTTQNIDIYLYDEPHVSIRLTRASNKDDSRSVCENSA